MSNTHIADVSKKDDTISRQEAIDTLDTMASFFDPYGEEMVSKYAVKIRLEFLRSISSERKTGRWINHRNDNGHNIADCCVCGNAIQWFDDDVKPRYCCMCGSFNGDKMDE